MLDYDFSYLCVSQTPVLGDVRDVTLAQTTRNGVVALISYEHMVRPAEMLTQVKKILIYF